MSNFNGCSMFLFMNMTELWFFIHVKFYQKYQSFFLSLFFRDFLSLLHIHGTWLFLDDRRDRPSRTLPGMIIFLSCFFLSNLTSEQWFLLCLRSSDGKFFTFDYFPCILDCLFFLFFAFYSVCVWRGVGGVGDG